MPFEQTRIPDVLVFQPEIFGDERGFFMETFRSNTFTKAGIPGPFVQDNHSGSQQGILRGLHYQIHQAQGKLVRTVSGDIFDVAVDLRRSSATFGRWVGMMLTAKDKMQLWIPPGFAHGFYVVSEWAEVVYKCTDYHAPEWERTLLWNDPTLGIDWPLLNGQQPVVSKKDSLGMAFSKADLFD